MIGNCQLMEINWNMSPELAEKLAARRASGAALSVADAKAKTDDELRSFLDSGGCIESDQMGIQSESPSRHTYVGYDFYRMGDTRPIAIAERYDSLKAALVRMKVR